MEILLFAVGCLAVGYIVGFIGGQHRLLDQQAKARAGRYIDEKTYRGPVGR